MIYISTVRVMTVKMLTKEELEKVHRLEKEQKAPLPTFQICKLFNLDLLSEYYKYPKDSEKQATAADLYNRTCADWLNRKQATYNTGEMGDMDNDHSIDWLAWYDNDLLSKPIRGVSDKDRRSHDEIMDDLITV